MEYSHEETIQQYIGFYGEDEGRTVKLITDAVSLLYSEWRLFLYFYCGPMKRVEALNAASGSTARTLQNLLWDSALLSVRRLTDPAGAKGNRNLSIERLKIIATRRCAKDLAEQYDCAILNVQECRKYATKFLAHRDFQHALKKQETQINRRATTQAIKAIGEFVKTFHRETRSVEFNLMPGSTAGNEEQFMMRLYLGNLRAEELEKEEYDNARAGKPFDRSDYSWPEWILDSKAKDPFYEF